MFHCLPAGGRLRKTEEYNPRSGKNKKNHAGVTCAAGFFQGKGDGFIFFQKP